MFLDLLSAFWKPLAAILAFVAVVGVIYYQGYQSGKEGCMEDWQKAEAARIEAINKEIDRIKETSDTLAKSQDAADKKLVKDISLIIKGLKENINKIGPSKIIYTTVENCKPSDAYVEKWNEISRRANTE